MKVMYLNCEILKRNFEVCVCVCVRSLLSRRNVTSHYCALTQIYRYWHYERLSPLRGKAAYTLGSSLLFPWFSLLQFFLDDDPSITVRKTYECADKISGTQENKQTKKQQQQKLVSSTSRRGAGAAYHDKHSRDFGPWVAYTVSIWDRSLSSTKLHSHSVLRLIYIYIYCSSYFLHVVFIRGRSWNIVHL